MSTNEHDQDPGSSFEQAETVVGGHSEMLDAQTVTGDDGYDHDSSGQGSGFERAETVVGGHSEMLDAQTVVGDGENDPNFGPGSGFEQAATVVGGESGMLDAPTLASIDDVEKLWGATCEQATQSGATLKHDSCVSFAINNSISVQQHSLLTPQSLAQAQAQAQEHSIFLGKPGEGTDGKHAADYEVMDLLGEGGIGVVYRARQTCIDRTIAVKMLKPGRSEDERARAKFVAEAAVTGKLDHPNIVPVYELAKDDAGDLFYVMKNVQGRPWSEKIGSLSLDENLDILVRVCDAVAFAHARHIIHRDLKPENVMLGDFGEVLVMDWGLAVPVNDEGRAVELGVHGALAGTPAYMAPEMALGDAGRIGITSDVYLLGAILYEIVTTRRPHSGRDVKTCILNAATNRINPTDLDNELVRIARKAMATQVEERYPTVKEFQLALRAYEEHAHSLSLGARARETLQSACRSRDYQEFARSLFSFHEAFDLWKGNTDAWQGAVEAAREYAACACERGDLDLAASLLDAGEPAHRELLDRIVRERDQRMIWDRRLHALKISAALLLVGVLGILGFSVYSIRERGYEEARLFREESMRRVRQNLKNNVDIAYAAVAANLKRASDPEYLRTRYGFRLRSIIQVAVGIIEYYAAEAGAGRMSAVEARRRARERIAAIRYDHGSGYVWINDTSEPFPRMIMHPIMPGLNGKVMNSPKYNCALGKKKNLFCAFRDVCARDGAGFVDYVWPKPTPDGIVQDVPKLSYVQIFKPWGWILGTGVYVDDAKSDAIAKSKADLRDMRFNNGTGYFWINDMARPFPHMVMHPLFPQLEGKILNNPKYNCALGKKENLFCAFRDVCARDGAGFVDYVWPKPTANGVTRPEPKLSYVRLYRPLGWVIGSGAYIDDIKHAVDRRVAAMQAEVSRMVRNLLYVALAAAIMAALAMLGMELWVRGKRESV